MLALYYFSVAVAVECPICKHDKFVRLDKHMANKHSDQSVRISPILLAAFTRIQGRKDLREG